MTVGAVVVVSRVEVNNRTGGGVILDHVLSAADTSVVVYSSRWFGGDSRGDVVLHLPNRRGDGRAARERISRAVGDREVSLVVCVPQDRADVVSLVAAVEATGAPAVTWIMDDCNLYGSGLDDADIRTLVDRSSVCFAISPLLCREYTAKFDHPFWLLPPVNHESLFAPADASDVRRAAAPRGVIIGNVWGRDVYDALRETVGGAGLAVDWYGNAGKPALDADPDELARSGIVLHPNLDDDALVARLRGHDYALMPSRELDPGHPLDFLYRASLPSRLVYLMTTAHLPIVVLGGGGSTAAQFVTGFGLGRVCAYEPDALVAAVSEVCDPTTAATIRRRAVELSPTFAAGTLLRWLQGAAAAGRPVDARFEDVFAGRM